jgi:serine/threonine-protein kinase
MAEILSSDWTRINDAADRFEVAWRTGLRPGIEDYLTEAEPVLRAALLEELLRVELELRRHDGEDPGPEEYRHRFPEQAAAIDAVFRGGISARPSDAEAMDGSAGPLSANFAPFPTASVVAALSRRISSLPHVLLRETDADQETAVLRPRSREMRAAAGRYQLLGQIGHGGMGAVLKARDPDLGRDLAVKVLLEEHRDDPDLIRRFIEEAQIGGQLQHPGIVPIHDLGQFDDGRPYFTMKLVKGRTLAALLADREIPEHDRPRLLGIFEQVCQTVAYAHARGVLHRDLKPSNIMVGSFGEVQVMDWGLAKVLPLADADNSRERADDSVQNVIRTVRSDSDAGTSTPGSVMGTPAYMAPEQARGEVEELSERSDVFGLGSILCEVLTGQPAYTGEHRMEIFLKARRGATADALERLDRCDADAELVTLARRCLEIDPDTRLRDAGEVARRMTAYLAGVQDRLRRAEQAAAAEEARAKEARATAAAAEGRARAERRARRLTIGLAASFLVAGALGATGWRWVERDRTARLAASSVRVNAALQEATRLVGRAQGAAVGDLVPWTEALAAAQRARELLEAGSDRALREQVESVLADINSAKQSAQAAALAAASDRALLDRLVEIRTAYVDAYDSSISIAAYDRAFREAGIDVMRLAPGEAGARIRARPATVAIELVAGIDHWADLLRFQRNDAAGADRLTAVAREVDPDPWRGQLRQAQSLGNTERIAALQRLARSPSRADLPSISFSLLSRGLRVSGGDHRTAEAVLRQGLHRYPRDVWLNFDLADCLIELHRRDEAIRYLMVARFFRPEAAFHLACLLEDKGETDEAIVLMQDLSRLKPDNTWYHIRLGQMLKTRGRAQEGAAALDVAIALLNAAVSRDPKNAYTHGELGIALREQGKLDEAIAEFRAAIGLGLDDAVTRAELGGALIDQGKLAEAVTELRAAIRLEPKNPQYHYDLGTALLLHNKLDDSVAEFRAAIQLALDDFPRAHANLGNALKAQGKVEEAIGEFRKAIHLKPDLVYAHVSLGATLCDVKHDYGAAIAAFRTAIQFKPDHACAYHNLGNALRATGELDNAIAEYRRALPFKPDHASHHDALAWSLTLRPNRPRREYDEGLVQARKAVEVTPKNGDFVNTLALALYRVGHWVESISACEQSMALRKGGDASDRFFLAMACATKGEHDRALAWFDKAVAWTKERADKNKDLLLFWAEAAKLVGRPAPDPSGPRSFSGPKAEKTRQDAAATRP